MTPIERKTLSQRVEDCLRELVWNVNQRKCGMYAGYDKSGDDRKIIAGPLSIGSTDRIVTDHHYTLAARSVCAAQDRTEFAVVVKLSMWIVLNFGRHAGG